MNRIMNDLTVHFLSIHVPHGRNFLKLRGPDFQRRFVHDEERKIISYSHASGKLATASPGTGETLVRGMSGGGILALWSLKSGGGPLSLVDVSSVHRSS